MTVGGIWPHIISTISNFPADVNDSDLFGGALFGDELMDVYTTSESGGDIPSLSNSSSSSSSNETNAPASSDPTNGSTAIAQSSDSSSVLDGLGAFRPSTSFNEIAELFPPEAPASSSQELIATTDNSNSSIPPAKQSLNQHTVGVSSEEADTVIASSAPAQVGPATAAMNVAVSTQPVPSNKTKWSTKKSVDRPNATTPAGSASKSIVKLQQQQQKRRGNTPNPLLTTRSDTASATYTKPLIKPIFAVASASDVPSDRSMATAKPVDVPQSAVQQSNKPQTPTNVAASTTPDNSSAPAIIVPIDHIAAKPTTTAPPSQNQSNPTSTPVANVVTPLVPVKTENDFTAVAQAAVSNLILTAGANAAAQQVATLTQCNARPVSDVVSMDTPNNKRSLASIDTSTAHIATLTSSNWMAAFNANANHSPPSVTTPAATTTHDEDVDDTDHPNPPAVKRRRHNLTPDERAKLSRDRNREHARNTRLRKKAYVEELKRTLTELVAQRDSAEMASRLQTQREMEQREVRFRVLEEFFKLRAANEPNVSKWVAILEDDFTLKLPVTPYRKMVNKENATTAGNTRLSPMGYNNSLMPRQVSIEGNPLVTPKTNFAHKYVGGKRLDSNGNVREQEQVLKGATQVMQDASFFAMFLNTTFGNAERDWAAINQATGSKIHFVYDCNRNRFFLDECTAVLNWTATTVGAVHQGAEKEFLLKGSIRANFSPASNKLVSAVMIFDTGAVLSQIQHILKPQKMIHRGFPNSTNVAAEAVALLDSIQMPFLPDINTNPTMARVNVANRKSLKVSSINKAH